MKKPKISKIKPDGKYCKKTSFGTKKDADYFIEKLQKESTRDKVPARSYLCAKCKAWHLTSWEYPDVLGMIRDINDEIEEMNIIMSEEYDECIGVMTILSNKLLETTKENKKLTLENYKLKYEK